MQKNLQPKAIQKRSQLKSGQITAVIYSIKIIIKFYFAANTVVTYPERHTVEYDSEKMQSNHNQNKLQIVVEPICKIVGEDSRSWTGRPGNKNASQSLTVAPVPTVIVERECISGVRHTVRIFSLFFFRNLGLENRRFEASLILSVSRCLVLSLSQSLTVAPVPTFSDGWLAG